MSTESLAAYNEAVNGVYRGLQSVTLFRGLRYTTNNESLRIANEARSQFLQAMKHLDPILAVHDVTDALKYLKLAAAKCQVALHRGGLSDVTSGRIQEALSVITTAVDGIERAKAERDEADRKEREAEQANFSGDRKRRDRFEAQARVLTSTADTLDHFGIPHAIEFVTPIGDLAEPLLRAADVAKDRRPQSVVDKLTAAAEAASASQVNKLWMVLFEIERALAATPDCTRSSTAP